MSETVLAAIIAGAVTLIVCVVNNVSQSKRLTDKVGEQQRQTAAMLEYKLDQLTRQVEKHNSLVERTYRLEQEAVLQDEKIKVANHRIQDLEDHAHCLRKEAPCQTS